MADDSAVSRPSRPAIAGATAWTAAGSIANGLGVLGLQIVGTRALGPVGYAPIGVLWTLQYLWIAVAVTAVEAYVTRLTTVEGAGGPELHRFLRLFTPWLLITTVAATAVAWILRGPLFDGVADLAFVLGLVVLGYGWYGALRGREAGSGRFHAYALATSAESLLRLVAAAVVLSIVATTRSLAWVFPLGPLLVVAVVWPQWHRSAQRPAASPQAPQGAGRRRVGTRFLAAASTANASVQFLLAGGPLVLLPLGADAVTVSVFFTTITAARVPMTFALNGGLSRVLPPLIKLAHTQDHAGLRTASLRLVAGVCGLAVLGALGAAAVGPELIDLVFGDAFRPGRLFVAVIATGNVLAVGGLLLDQVYIAMGREARLPAVWLSAILVAGLLVLMLPGTPELRVAGAFTLATALAVVGLSIPLLRPTRS